MDNFDVQLRYDAAMRELAIQRERAHLRFKSQETRDALEAVLLGAFRQAASQTPELFTNVDLPRLANMVAGIILRGEA